MPYGDPEREFKTLYNKNGGKVSAHVLTEDTAWVENEDGERRRCQVRTPGGESRYVHPGDVLVETNNPDVFDVVSAKDWKEGGYSDKKPSQKDADDSDKGDAGEDKGEAFDPSEHTVAEVREHVEANPDDRTRVHAAERAGKNRSGVFN